MKLIIAGGRNYQLTADGFRALDEIPENMPVTEVVSGRASGIDASGERWAKSRGIPVRHFPADWRAFGRSAGPRRNAEMANYADALAIFPGGAGSRDMLRKAKARVLIIFDYSDRLDFVSKID